MLEEQHNLFSSRRENGKREHVSNLFGDNEIEVQAQSSFKGNHLKVHHTVSFKLEEKKKKKFMSDVRQILKKKRQPSLSRFQNKFSPGDGKIYVNSRKKEHKGSMASFCQGVYEFLEEFAATFCCKACSFGGIPEVEVGGDTVGELPKFKTFEERMYEEWKKIKGHNSGSLSLQDLKAILRRLNVSLPHQDVVDFMKKFDEESKGELNFEHFVKMFPSLQSVPDLRVEFLRAKLMISDQDELIDTLGVTVSPNWQKVKKEFLLPRNLQWFLQHDSNRSYIPSLDECSEIIKLYSPQRIEDEEKRKKLEEQTNKKPENRFRGASLGSYGESISNTLSMMSPQAAVSTIGASVTSLFRAYSSPKPLDEVSRESAVIEEPQMSYESFVSMLTDTRKNSVINKELVNKVYQDMTQPLSHYFISSSHNSYLNGNQLNSDSSPGAIKRILKAGVRVIELDCWDGADGQPIVTHGHTLCKPTTLQECVEAVNTYAFITSEYPVILTLENHCNLKQQAEQVRIFNSVFGDKLFRFDSLYPVPENISESSRREFLEKAGPLDWLSPEDLKGRIVLRDRCVKKKKNKEAKEFPNSSPVDRVDNANKFGTAAKTKNYVLTAAKNATKQPIAKLKKTKLPGNMNIGVPRRGSGSGRLEQKHTTHGLRQDILTNSPELLAKKPQGKSFLRAHSLETYLIGSAQSDKLKLREINDLRTLSTTSANSDVSNAGALDSIQSKKKVKQGKSKAPGKDLELLRLVYIRNVSLAVNNGNFDEIVEQQKSVDTGKENRMMLVSPDFASSSSIKESQMKKLVQPGHNSAMLNTYTKKHLIRAYPAGTRIYSTNFDPIPAWNAGIQIVALNYQSLKLKVWLNEGKFMLNGKCGYILKPPQMLQSADVGVVQSKRRTGSVEELPALRPWTLDHKSFKPRNLRVRVISAHYLPKTLSSMKFANEKLIINPFVEVKLRGIKSEDYKTQWVKENGFNPRWNEEFLFKVHFVPLALLAFVVKSKNSGNEGAFVAQRVVPVEAILEGTRVVNLSYKNGSRIDTAYLLCHFTWEVSP
eukprot:augustus_masked-scaffold_18-processed-gene-5.9-mRNA-1 protein AED:0.20 eAED:0.21 QI:0/-1/0/1/-1/1/1/0/1047